MLKKRPIKELETYQGKTIQVMLYYNKGGQNYFTGKVEQRGYYLSVTPCLVECRPGYLAVTTGAFTGYRELIKTAKRFSQKALNELDVPEKTINNLIDAVLLKNGLTLK